MSRKSPGLPVLAGAAAVAAVLVLVLGAASHGFEPSLAGAPTSTPAPTVPNGPAPATPGQRLRASVVKLLVDRADGSAAVVIRIANADERRAVTDVLIVTDLVDRPGAVVGTSTAAGTDPLRVHVPYVAPGESVLFVTDTIAAGAAPAGARVSASGTFSAPHPARLEIRTPQLRHNVFGWSATATLYAPATDLARKVLVEAVVRRDRSIVAAGTTIALVPPRARTTAVEILLIGDARGGEPSVWAATP